MGVFTYETEVTSSIPPAKMFKAFVLDVDLLGGPLPNIVPLPQAIKNVEILEGNGGPGTIKKITFVADSQIKYFKHKIEGIDKENFTYSYSVIEGDALMDALKKISYEIKLMPSLMEGAFASVLVSTIPKVTLRLRKTKLRAAKKEPRDCSRLLKATSWQILIPTTKV